MQSRILNLCLKAVIRISMDDVADLDNIGASSSSGFRSHDAARNPVPPKVCGRRQDGGP